MTLPTLYLISVLVCGMLLCLSVGLLWRAKANRQLRLDRCVEKMALEVASIQTRIEQSNARMATERAAAIAAAGPTAGASLRAAKIALEVERVYQEVLRSKWRSTQLAWLANRGCDGKGDAFFPLPNLEWWRPPDDPIGASTLRWKGNKSSGMKIKLWNGNLVSLARVSVARADSAFPTWKAKWETLLPR